MIRDITLNNERICLANTLDFEIKCQAEFGKPSVKILKESETNDDILATAKVAYCMITPKPSFSFEDFCKKMTPSDLATVAKTVGELVSDSMPTKKQEEKLKNS